MIRPATGNREERLGKIYDHRLIVRILRYLRPSARLIWLALALLVLFSLASLAGPMVTRIGIDEYITGNDESGLIRICLLWFGLLVLTAALQYPQILVTNLIGQRAMMRLRIDIYRKLQRLPISFFDNNPVGRLMTRVTNDVEVLNQMFTQGVVAVFGDIFILVGITIILVVMNGRLALVTFASLPVVFLISIQFRKGVRQAFRDVRVALARINSYLQETFGGIAVIQAFRREPWNDNEFAELNSAHRDAFLRSVRAFAIYFPLVELIQSVTVALILWYGAGQVIREELTFGALVAFIQYAGRFFRPIRDLSDKFNIFQDAMASSERIFGLLDRPEEPKPTEASRFDPNGDIRFENVSFSYDGKIPVLREVSFTIPTGKTTAIVGVTGAGKSTIIDLLSSFYEPTAGSITISGVEIRGIPKDALRRSIARVQQDVFLFSGTIEDNIRLWEKRISSEAVHQAIKTSHADFLIDRLPAGLQSIVTERGSSFSTGERQLLAFARALAFDPAILVLDEATASIDSETEALIQDALRALLENRTAVVIAHRLSTIRRADQILVLHHGRICERGTHDELLREEGLYARLYNIQLQGQAAL